MARKSGFARPQAKQPVTTVQSPTGDAVVSQDAEENVVSVNAEATGDGIRFEKLNKGRWLFVETEDDSPDSAVDGAGDTHGMTFLANRGSIYMEAARADANGYGIHILDNSDTEMLLESEATATLKGGNGFISVAVDPGSGIVIDPNNFGVAIEDDTTIDGTLDVDGALDMNTHQIHNVVDPTSNQDAATKKYVDDNTGPTGIQFATTNTGTYLEIATTGSGGEFTSGISLKATGAFHDVWIQSDANIDMVAESIFATTTAGTSIDGGAVVSLGADAIEFRPNAGGKVTIYDSDGTTVIAEWTAS